MPRLQLLFSSDDGLPIEFRQVNEWNEGGIASNDSSLIGDGSFCIFTE